MHKDDQNKPTLKLLADLGNIEGLTEDESIHSAIFHTLEKIAFLDTENLYVVELKTKKAKKYEEIYCLSFNQFEKPYIYALC